MNSTEGKVYQYGKYYEIIKFEKRTNSCNELARTRVLILMPHYFLHQL